MWRAHRQGKCSVQYTLLRRDAQIRSLYSQTSSIFKQTCRNERECGMMKGWKLATNTSCRQIKISIAHRHKSRTETYDQEIYLKPNQCWYFTNTWLRNFPIKLKQTLFYRHCITTNRIPRRKSFTCHAMRPSTSIYFCEQNICKVTFATQL